MPWLQIFGTIASGSVIALLVGLVRHVLSDIKSRAETRTEIAALKERTERIERHLNGALK